MILRHFAQLGMARRRSEWHGKEVSSARHDRHFDLFRGVGDCLDHRSGGLTSIFTPIAGMARSRGGVSAGMAHPQRGVVGAGHARENSLGIGRNDGQGR